MDVMRVADGNPFTTELSPPGSMPEVCRMIGVQIARIDLVDVKKGKYFRILATVLADGRDMAGELLAAGLAREIEGSRRPE